MTDHATNPYEFSDSNAAAASPTMQPGGITPIVVISIILAIMGALGALGMIAGPAITRGIQQQVIRQAEANPDDAGLQMQADMQRQAMALAEKYGTANLAIGIVQIGLCITLLVAGIMALKGSTSGRSLLAMMCLLMLLFDLGKTVFLGIQQKETMDGISGAMTKMLETDPDTQGQGAVEVQDAMQIGMKVGVVVGLVFAIGWFLVKAGFYLFSWRYLNRPNVTQWFESQQPIGA